MRIFILLIIVVLSSQSAFAQIIPDTLDLNKQIEIEEVVVTGTRSEKRLSESPILTTLIRSSDIVKAGNTTMNQVLEDNIPGLLVYDAGAMGTDMYIKGLTTQYILILVDGERLASNGRSGNVNLDQIDVTTVQRVEYINGAASSLYGSNAMGGVINIITKNPTQKISTGAEYAYENTGNNKVRANVSSKLDKFAVSANGSYAEQDYYVPDEGSVLSEYDEASADLKIQYNPKDRMKITGTGRYYQIETFNAPGSASVSHSLERSFTAGGLIDYTSSDYKNNITASISYNGSYQYDVLSEEYDNFVQPNDLNGYFSSRVIDSYTFNKKLDVMGGVEFNREGSSSVDKLESGDDDSTIANKSLIDASLLAQADWDIYDNFTAIIGARFTYNEMFGSSFDPKLSLLYKLNKFSFRGGIGTAYKAPTLRELYYDFEHTGGGSAVFYISGNPDLKAEKGFFSSLSTEYTTKDFNVSGSLYYNNIRNKINMVTDYGSDYSGNMDNQVYENVGQAIIYGFDMNLRYTLLQQIVLNANYTLNFSEDAETGLQIAGTSRHYCTLSTTWNGKIKNEPFSIQASGRLSSPRFSYSDGELVSTENYSIWKAVLVKPITINEHVITVTFKVDNIFNFTHDYYTTVGRQFMFGLRYNFN